MLNMDDQGHHTLEGAFVLGLGLGVDAGVDVDAGKVLADTDRVSNNLNAVFDADNQPALKSTLPELSRLMAELAALSASLRRLSEPGSQSPSR